MKKRSLLILMLLLTCKMLVSQTILGIDVSHWQGTINWTQVRAAGKSFAWAKATEGVTGNDAQFSTNMVNGNNAGVVMGAYHFARPDNNSAVNEANHFLSVASSYIGAGYLPPALDLEASTSTYNSQTLTAWVQTWMTTVQNATGVAPVIYVNSSYAAFLNSSVNTYGLWIAKWDGSATAPPTGLGVWNTWAFKQYTSTGSVSGISGSVDLDVFNGNTTQFNNLIGSGVPQPANDYCNHAVSLTVNNSCNYLANQNLNGATSSAPPSNCTGGGTGTVANDVWYSFTATAACQNITVDGGSGFDAVVRLYSGCGGNGPTGFMTCVDQTGNGGVETISATGLTIGATYYVSVYEYTGAGQGLTFSICVFNPGTPGQPGSITGNQSPCVGSSQTYSVGSVSGATSYVWNYPSGWVTNGSTTNSISFSAVGANSGSIAVNAVNGCGTGTPRTLAVTPSSNTGQPGSISGNSTPCQGSSQTYSIASVPGAISYSWTYPNGWSTAGSSSPSIYFNNVGSGNGNVSVVANYACGSSGASTVFVSPVPIPGQPGSITGNQNPCVGSSQAYSIASVSGATSYTWTYPSGWATNGSTSNSISFSAIGPNSGSISVTASNACGTSTSATLSVAPSSIPVAPGLITGNPSPCIGSWQTYSVASLSGANSYTWTFPSGWITNGSTSNSITFSSVGTLNGNITVSANYPCGSSTASTIFVAPVPFPSQPGSITGNQSPCLGSIQSYSVGTVSGASSYYWSFPTGWSISSGQGSNSIVVTVGSSGGNVTVSASSSCGTSPTQALAVAVGSAPQQPGTIAPSIPNPCDGMQVTYSITPVPGASGYVWSVPSGWIINGGQGTTSLLATIIGSGGNVSVAATNACGIGSSQVLSVTLGTGPAQPNSISTSNSSPCHGSQATYTISPVPGANSYNWTVPSGWIINGGQGTNSLLVTVMNIGGTVSVTADNNCGVSIAQTLAVVLGNSPAQPGSISPSIPQPCIGDQISLSINPVFGAYSYNWAVPSSWIINGGQGTTSLLVTVLGSGGTVTVSASNNCGTSAMQSLTLSASVTPQTPVSIFASDPNPCVGDQVTYSIAPVSGATMYVWALPNGWVLNGGQGTTSIVATVGNASGNVTVTAGSNCGTSSMQSLPVNVTSLPASPVTISSSNPNPSAGLQVTFSANPVSGATSYTWSVPVGWVINSGQGTTILTTTLGSGGGDVCLSAENACGSSLPTCITVSPITGSDLMQGKMAVSIYPNPTTGMVTISFISEALDEVTVTLFDMFGRQLRKQAIDHVGSDYRVNLDLALFAKATYLVRLSAREWVQYHKIIRN